LIKRPGSFLVEIENIFRECRANSEAALRETRNLILQKVWTFSSASWSVSAPGDPFTFFRAQEDFMIDIAGATENTLKSHHCFFPDQLSRSGAQGCDTARYAARMLQLAD
jgi:hypothetical protein